VKEAQPGEVGVQVALREPAAEFDDRHGPPASVGAIGERVRRRELKRGEAGARAAAGDVELRACLRAVIQAEHGDDAALELARDRQLAGALAVRDGAAVRRRAAHQLQRRTEDLSERAGRSAYADAP
jgi:hypothetical protein